MKKILFVLSLFVFVTACKQDKKEVIKDITFSGKIENAKGDSLMIRKDDTTQKFAIAEDGSFSGTVNGGSGFYQMRYKRKRANLYFDQGQETIMNTNFEAFDSTLVFTGTGAAVNNYLKSKGDLADEFSNEIPMKDLYSMDEDAFQEKINAYEKRMLNHLNSANLPEAFSAMQAKNIGFEVINNKVNFESYHQYFAKDEEFKVSDTYNAQFDNLGL